MNNISFLEEEIDISPLFQICLESEMTWNNIFVEGCESEFNAILKEDVQLLNEIQENILHRIVRWIKDKIKSIKAAVRDMTSKIMMKSLDIQKFVKESELKLNKKNNGKDLAVETEVRNWSKDINDPSSFVTILKNNVLVVQAISKLITSNKGKYDDSFIKSNTEKLDSIKELFNLNTPNIFLKDNSTHKEKVSLVKRLFFLDKYKLSVDAVKLGSSTVLMDLNEMHSMVESFGREYSKDEQTLITMKKKCINTVETIETTTLSMIFKYTLESISIIRKGLR